MAFTSEPNISGQSKPEEAFQRAIVGEIAELLKEKRRQQDAASVAEFIILQNFGLDVAVFVHLRDGRRFTRFLELKAFVGSRQGGVGFGDGKGHGSQIDLLLLPEAQLALGDIFSRWILVDGNLPVSTARFVMFTNQEAREAAMGGVRRDKQNNLRVKPLIKSAITWEVLSHRLSEFLSP